MNLDANNDRDADFLIQNVNRKLLPIFLKKNFNEKQKRSIYRYLFSRRPKKLPPSLKNHLINLYDPMADRTFRFPDGLRWCLNVYVGCHHNCGYCYVNVYSQNAVGNSPHQKKDFEKNLAKDLEDLKILGVPSVPLHMSNSTDPLQEKLELKYRHTNHALKMILKNRGLFTSLVMLTKNPQILCEDTYLSIITSPDMQPITIQVSCSFWRDEVRSFYEPNAPSVDSRLKAMSFLSKRGVDIDLRLDPLFPSSRIPKEIRAHRSLPSYAIPEAQTQDDIVSLIRFAKNNGIKKIIVNTLKVPVSNRAKQCKNWFGNIYADSKPGGGRTARGASWRLPEIYQKALVNSVSDICAQKGINFLHCKHDVLSRE